MTSTPRLMRPLLLGAVVLALASASSGCSMFKHKSSYAKSVESRPLEVPPDLDLPNTSAATSVPTAAGLGGAQAMADAAVMLSVPATVAYPKVGKALEGIEGVVINGRAEALGSYDVTYQGQSFLVRIQDSGAGSRLMAISPDGRILGSAPGPAADLLVKIKTTL